MTEARCDCCDLPVNSCGKAAEVAERKRDAAHRAELLARPGVIGAVFAGICAKCGERVEVGDPITKSHDGWHFGWYGLLCCERST